MRVPGVLIQQNPTDRVLIQFPGKWHGTEMGRGNNIKGLDGGRDRTRNASRYWKHATYSFSVHQDEQLRPFVRFSAP
jgi:hypothetical protein